MLNIKLEYTNIYKNTLHLSHFMRKPIFCICENKDADQLCGNRKADKRVCFRYIDSPIPLLSTDKQKASRCDYNGK